MTIPEQIYEIDAYADGEVDPVRAIEIERLMAQKPELRQRYDSILNVRSALREAAAQDSASDLLQPRIERNARSEASCTTSSASTAFPVIQRAS